MEFRVPPAFEGSITVAFVASCPNASRSSKGPQERCCKHRWQTAKGVQMHPYWIDDASSDPSTVD